MAYSLTVTVVKDCPESTFAQALEYVHPTSDALAGGRVYGDWLAPVRELPELGGSVLSTAVSFFWVVGEGMDAERGPQRPWLSECLSFS